MTINYKFKGFFTSKSTMWNHRKKQRVCE